MSLTKKDVERWHKQIGEANGKLAAALAKGKRPPGMLDEVFELLTDVCLEIETFKND